MPGSAYDLFNPTPQTAAKDPFGNVDLTGGSKLFAPIPATAPNMSPIGSLVPAKSGSNPSGAVQDGPSWWDTHDAQVGGITNAAIPLIVSLFGNNEFKDKTAGSADKLSQLAQLLSKQGTDLTKTGTDALHPVLQYLLALTGADPAALAQATQPERAKVLDQYDTARKAIQFLPRGGGQASATMQSGAKAASDISSIVANARNSATNSLGALSTNLINTGINTTEAGGNAEQAAGRAYADLAKQKDEELGGFGKGLGQAISMALAFL